MRRLRLGLLREGVWTRPDNLPRASAPTDAWNAADAQCSWWSGTPDDDPTVLAATLFASEEWARRATALTTRLSDVTTALVDAPDATLADGFVAGAASLAHIRSDPMLPEDLVPGARAGTALRRAYGAYEDEFSKALRAWFLGR